MKELFGIDIDQVCDDLETGKSVDINDYVDQSVWEQTIKNSSKNNETITWSDLWNNAAINDTTDSQTKNELNTTTEESNADSYEHPSGLHWVKDTSMYNRSETYLVWDGTQKCGKIHIYNKGKGKYKVNIGKWYVSPQVLGPYYDTIEKAATACWEDFISQHTEQTATEPEYTELEEELIPF